MLPPYTILLFIRGEVLASALVFFKSEQAKQLKKEAFLCVCFECMLFSGVGFFIQNVVTFLPSHLLSTHYLAILVGFRLLIFHIKANHPNRRSTSEAFSRIRFFGVFFFFT